MNPKLVLGIVDAEFRFEVFFEKILISYRLAHAIILSP
jgi:hypothetical protein